jgi:F-type H+-transporting ATPase subunit epsilon
VSDAGTLGAELVTPEAVLFAGGADGVILRTSEGDLTVLAGHTPLVGDLVPGILRLQLPDGLELSFLVHGGFVQVATAPGAAEGLLEAPATERTTRVTLLAGVAEAVGDVDVSRARGAREAAAQRLSGLGTADDEGTLAERVELEAAIARAELRLEAAGASTPQ